MSDHPMTLGGTCSARCDPLRELFAAKLESGEDLGASLAVNIDGEMVVDLWGGWADEARTVPWAEDTITCVFSTTKTMASLAALVLVDRGELDLDANVAAYWPEFGARGRLLGRPKGVLGKSKLDGKEDEVRMLLGKQVSKASIAKIVDVSPTALRHFIRTRRLDSESSKSLKRGHRP
jgi:CubicO group peptidase (beta-lactamase class C family)